MKDNRLFKRIAKLKVPVPDIADGCRALGFVGQVTNPSLRPAVPFSRLAGTAVTIREYLADGPNDYLEKIAKVYNLGRSVPHAVLVIRNEVPGFSCMGSGGARVAMAHGYVGCVVNGAIRDTQELPDVGFALFGTLVSPDSVHLDQHPPGKSIHFDFGGTVGIAGAEISQGDIVVADNDGLIAVDSDQIEAVVEEAEKILKGELKLFAFLKKGRTFEDYLAMKQKEEKQSSPPKQNAGKGRKGHTGHGK